MNWSAWSRSKWHRKKKCRESVCKKSELSLPFQVQQNSVRKKNLFIDPFKKIPISSERHDYIHERNNLYKEKTLPKGWRKNTLPNHDTFGGGELVKDSKTRLDMDIEELTWKDLEFKAMLKHIEVDDFIKNTNYNVNLRSHFSSIEPQIRNKREIKNKDSFSSAVIKDSSINEDFKRYVYGDRVRKSSINCFNDIHATTKTNPVLTCDLESEIFNDSIRFNEDIEDEIYDSTHSPFFRKSCERKSTTGISEPMMLSETHHKNNIKLKSAKIFEQIVANEFEDYAEKFKSNDSSKFLESQSSRNNYKFSNLNLRNHNSRDHLPFKIESDKENFNVESSFEESLSDLEPPAFFQRKKRRKSSRKQNVDNVPSYSPKENELKIRVKNSNPLKTEHKNNYLSDSLSAYTQQNINPYTLDLFQSNQKNNCNDKETVKVLKLQLKNDYQISVKQNLEQDATQRPLQVLSEESQSRFRTLKRSLTSDTVSRNSNKNSYEGKDVTTNSSVTLLNITKCSTSSKYSLHANHLNINLDRTTIRGKESMTSTTSENMSEIHNKEVTSIIETKDSVLNVKDSKLFEEESKIPESIDKNPLEKNVEECPIIDSLGDSNIGKRIAVSTGNEENYKSNSLLTENNSHSKRTFNKICNCDIFLNNSEDHICQASIPESDAWDQNEINDVIVDDDLDKCETLIFDYNEVGQEIKIQEIQKLSTTVIPSETTTLNYKPGTKSSPLEEKLKIHSKETCYAANEIVANFLNQIEETIDKHANSHKFPEHENASVSDSSSTDLFLETAAKTNSLKKAIGKKYSLKNITTNGENEELSSSAGNVNSKNYDTNIEDYTTSETAIVVEKNDDSPSNFNDENYKGNLEISPSEHENCEKPFVKTNNLTISLPRKTNLKHKIDYYHKATQTDTETADCLCQIDVSKTKLDNSTQTMQP